MRVTHLLAGLCAAATATAEAAGEATPSYPSRVELDLVFPLGNSTYQPLAYFPIVFGLQNASAGWPAGLTISWTLNARSSLFPAGPDRRDDGGVSAGSSNATGYYTFPGLPSSGSPPSDPYYFIAATNLTNHPDEAEWVLQWQFGVSRNCSSSGGSAADDMQPAQGDVTFRTAADGQVPDVTAGWCVRSLFNAVQPSPWGIAMALPFSFASVSSNDTGTGGTCAVLQDPAPSPDPCALTVGSAVASSVSAAMLATASCSTGVWPNITAPCSAAAAATASWSPSAGSPSASGKSSAAVGGSPLPWTVVFVALGAAALSTAAFSYVTMSY